MSREIFFRALLSGVWGLGIAWTVFSRFNEEIAAEDAVSDLQKYRPYIPGNLLPAFLLVIAVLGLWYYGAAGTAKMMLSMCFGLFFQILVYDLLLLAALPFLRKHISARSCAMLWLLPSYLYITIQGAMKLPSPAVVITASGKWVWGLPILWFTGFCLVLLWKIREHLRFRRHILKGAKPVTDPEVLALWQKILTDACFKKPKFRLLISSRVSTPVTIGLFPRAVRVVLPERRYDLSDLELILRHEMIHIGREDAWSKFFMVFCTAMGWFNPLNWIAMGKSADDLERSCDETVLLHADDATRRQYAEFVLSAAGDERGFTTCLSASARALRYRLRSITKPGNKHSGALVVGGLFFLLCMTSGYVALAYGGGPGSEIIYQREDPDQYTVRKVTLEDDPFDTQYDLSNQKAFHEYLAGLTLRECTGSYTFSNSEKECTYMMDTPRGRMALMLTDHAIKLVFLHSEAPDSVWYYIPEGVDWAHVESLLRPYPALEIHLEKEGDSYGSDHSATLVQLWERREDGLHPVYQDDRAGGEYNGIYGTIDYHRATFSFSRPLAAPCTVTVENWDRSDRQIFTQAELSQPLSIEIPAHSAHYTIHASFYAPDGGIWEAEYRFDLERA